MPSLEPRNPHYVERVRKALSLQPVMAHIGAAPTSIQPGEVAIELPYLRELTQQNGFIHGGIVGLLADNACAAAAGTLASADAGILTVEYKLNFLAPAAGERLVARGRVIRPGRTLMIAEAGVFALKDGRETQVATALATLMILDGRSEVAS
jgi:uncharacterized protein (TIGR00369 family)